MNNQIETIKALEVEPNKNYLVFITVDDGYICDGHAIDTAVKGHFVSLGLDSSAVSTIVLHGAHLERVVASEQKRVGDFEYPHSAEEVDRIARKTLGQSTK